MSSQAPGITNFTQIVIETATEDGSLTTWVLWSLEMVSYHAKLQLKRSLKSMLYVPFQSIRQLTVTCNFWS